MCRRPRTCKIPLCRLQHTATATTQPFSPPFNCCKLQPHVLHYHHSNMHGLACCLLHLSAALDTEAPPTSTPARLVARGNCPGKKASHKKKPTSAAPYRDEKQSPSAALTQLTPQAPAEMQAQPLPVKQEGRSLGRMPEGRVQRVSSQAPATASCRSQSILLVPH